MTVYGSDAIVDLLVDLGVDIIPFAPGATFRGLHDSLVHHRTDAPEIIECLHEEISVAVAHGYAKATGKLAAAALHDIVGLQHAAMAIYNAWCDRAPVLLLGGSGPADAQLRRPWIDWIHTANVQATQIRDYTKWDDQPASLPAAMESLVRARQLALSAPCGPVYIALDSEIQEQPVPTDWAPPAANRFPVTEPLAPSADAIRRIAARLAAARAPVIAVESVDRDQGALLRLVELAELIGAPVVEVQRDYNRTELCMPTRHPLNHTGMPLSAPPDVVLALEVRDTDVIPGCAGVPVIQVSTAGLAVKAWAADLQRVQAAEMVVAAQVRPTLDALVIELKGLIDPSDTSARVARLATHSEQYRAVWAATAAGAQGITPALLADRLGVATGNAERVLANGSLHNWVHRLWSIDHVGAYLGSSGGAGLGYGLGASIGAALAHRGSGRLVVDIQSDGDALMTPGALWTAARHRVPLLIVMENNRMWGNSFVHAQKMARARGRSNPRPEVGTVIDDPAVDFAGLARAQGVSATWTVAEAAGLDGALAAAVDHVLSRRAPALVDVVTTAD
ncbi:Benzoylformate decarboxylase [Mycolicibacterium vanbaalenii]|uniref:acetolactate synthase n=1 Tax=Mycolicibacterium vanbaalenii TaxID=110539 RepID=A0A5S9R446_MYCVN|nr:thiamine pyrophosphate-dependent enzyme [Mycolicibacterium vanbaalenii]CAA0128096.1 Benzoylformate decarboxylase [Mycolicibacterium vanbaalenii]